MATTVPVTVDRQASLGDAEDDRSGRMRGLHSRDRPAARRARASALALLDRRRDHGVLRRARRLRAADRPLRVQPVHGRTASASPSRARRRRPTGWERPSSPRTCSPGSSSVRAPRSRSSCSPSRSASPSACRWGSSPATSGVGSTGHSSCSTTRSSPSRYLLLAIVIAFLLQNSRRRGGLHRGDRHHRRLHPPVLPRRAQQRAVGARGVVRRGGARARGQAAHGHPPVRVRQRHPVRPGRRLAQRRRRHPHARRALVPRHRHGPVGRGRMGLRHLAGHLRRPGRLLVDGAVPGDRDHPPRHRPHPRRRGAERQLQPAAAPAGPPLLRPAGRSAGGDDHRPRQRRSPSSGSGTCASGTGPTAAPYAPSTA